MAKEITISPTDLFLEIDGNAAISRRGDYILAYKIHYHPRYTQGQTELETLKSTWDRALQSLSIGTIVCKTDLYEKSCFDASVMPKDTFLQEATARHFSGREYLEHSGYLFFLCPRNNTLNGKQIKNPFVFPTTKQFENDNSNTTVFRTNVIECITTLNRSEQVKIEEACAEDLMSVVSFWLNGGEREYATDLCFGKTNITTDHKQIGLYSITSELALPEMINAVGIDGKYSSSKNDFTFYCGMIDELGITLPCSHIVNQIIIIDDTKKHLNNIYTARDGLFKLRKFGHENILAMERIDEYMIDMRLPENDGMRFVRANTSVIYFADTSEEFETQKNNIKAQFNAIGIPSVYVPTGERLKNLYINSLFVNTPMLDVGSYYLVDLRVATCLLIANGGYEDDKEGFYFQDRIFNKPVKFDWWDAGKKRLVSRNFAVFAPTGRGKSVLSAFIHMGLMDTQNTINVIIDLGRSYEKMSTLYPQEDVGYFRYVEGEPLGLNPFELSENEEDVGELKIEQICDIVWVLIKKTGEPNELERTSLRVIVEAYYVVMLSEKKRDVLSWQTFYNFVKTNGNALYKSLDIDSDYFNLKEFLHAGSDFTTKGIYGHIFEKAINAPKSALVNKKLIIFELDELKDNALLLTIMLQIISETIHNVIWKDRSTRGIVFFDEFGKTLHFPGIMDRVSYYAQAIRKQEGSLALVLQSATQFPDTPQANSTLGNIETIIVLPSGDIMVLDSLAKRKSLSNHDLCQIKSMRHNFSGDRKYTEFFIKRGDNFSCVFRLELAPEVLLALETEGTRAEEMMQEYRKCANMELVIQNEMKKTIKM